MFYRNTDAWYALLMVDIPKRLKLLKLDKSQEKPFLINCMQIKGYIKTTKPVPKSPEQFQEVGYREIKGTSGNSQQFMPGVNESLNYIQGTTIATDLLPRLAEVHKRGITSQETLDQKLNEIYDDVLGSVTTVYQDLVNQDNIKNYAMRLYHEISQVYKDTTKLKGEMKATRNRGYTVLCLYYSLVNFGICVTREQLIEYFNYTGKTSMSRTDLAEAEKNMQMILKLPEEHKICLCNMKSLFNGQVINLIRSEIERLQEIGIFTEPVQKIQVALLIHHLTKTPMKTISQRAEIDEDTLRKHKNKYKF